MDSLLGQDLDMEMTGKGPEGEETPVQLKAPAPVPSELQFTDISTPNLTNKGSAPPPASVVDDEFMETYRQVQGIYGNMEGDDKVINNMTLQNATILHNMKKELRDEIRKTREDAEMNTEEGRAIAYVMQQFPAVGKEGARQILQKTNQLRLEHSGNSPKTPSGPKLSPHDRKMIRTLGLSDQAYLGVLGQLEKGPSLNEDGVVRFENGFGVNSKNEVVFEKF